MGSDGFCFSGDKDLDADSSVDLCLRALELGSLVLKPSGVIVVKVFQGRAFQAFFKTVRLSRFPIANPLPSLGFL